MVTQSVFQNIFDGLLLSDGCLYNQKSGYKNCKYEHGGKHRLFLIHIMEIFRTQGYTFGPKSPYGKKSNIKNHERKYWFIHSSRTDYLSEQKVRWYSNGNKIVPEDIILTPKTVEYWYLGDGCLAYVRGRTQYLQLATHGFTWENVEFLKYCLLRDAHLKSYINNQYGRPRLTISRKDIEQFLSYIGPYNVSCYQYKYIVNNRILYDQLKNNCICVHEQDNQQPSL